MSNQNEQKTHIVFPYMGCTVTINGDKAKEVKDKILGKTYHLAVFDEIGVPTELQKLPAQLPEENGDWQ